MLCIFQELIHTRQVHGNVLLEHSYANNWSERRQMYYKRMQCIYNIKTLCCFSFGCYWSCYVCIYDLNNISHLHMHNQSCHHTLYDEVPKYSKALALWIHFLMWWSIFFFTFLFFSSSLFDKYLIRVNKYDKKMLHDEEKE